MAGQGKRTVTTEMLDDLIGDLRERASILAALRKATEKNGGEVEAMGRPMALRGVNQIDTFIHNLKRELSVL